MFRGNTYFAAHDDTGLTYLARSICLFTVPVYQPDSMAPITINDNTFDSLRTIEVPHIECESMNHFLMHFTIANKNEEEIRNATKGLSSRKQDGAQGSTTYLINHATRDMDKF